MKMVKIRLSGAFSKKLFLALAFCACGWTASAGTIRPTDYARKVEIALGATAQAALGASTLTNFPALVRLSTGIAGFSYGDFWQSAGSDLVFADTDGNALDFEIDTWNDQGESLVWVKVPSLSTSSVIYAYYGGSAYAHAPPDTWTEYLGVWHFSGHDAGGITPDATVNGLNGDSGDFTEITGRVGGAAQGGKGIAGANYEPAHPVGGTFSASGWFRLPNQTSQYTTFVTKKTGLNWDASTGWYLEMPQSKTKIQLVSSGGSVFATGATAVPDVSQNWNYFHLTSNGSTVNLYLNGSMTPVASGSTAVMASSAAFTMLGSGQQGDEFRLGKTAHSALRASIEYATMSSASFLSYGAAVVIDATAPVFNTPTVAKDGSDFVFSADLLEGEGTVSAIYTAGASVVTNALSTTDVEYPKTFSATASGLAADTTYLFSAYGINTNQTEVLKRGGTFHTGNLSVVKTQDAQENGLFDGIFTVTRTDTNNTLTVAYAVGGTAVAGQTYAATAGTVTIPAGSTAAPIVVTPLMDGQTTEDTTVVVTLSAGLYGIDESAGSATLTVKNLVTPAGYNTWVATAAGKASVGQNWSEGRVPNATDNILLDGNFSTANCEWDTTATHTVASWTQTADFTGTNTFPITYDTSFPVFTVTGNCDIGGGAFTHPTNEVNGTETYRLNLSVGGNFTLGTNAVIALMGRGFKYGYCKTGSFIACHAAASDGNVAHAYGALKAPIDVGSGGDSANNAKSCGGGAFALVATGTATIDGVIDVRSSEQVGNPEKGHGAGGSVFVTASAISGAGMVNANCFETGTAYTYGGSGGRIALVATSESVTIPAANLKANGGVGSKAAGAGTIFIKGANDANGRLIVGNNKGTSWSYLVRYPSVGSSPPVIPGETWTLDAIELRDNGILTVPASATLSLPSGFESVTRPSTISTRGAPVNAGGIVYNGGTIAVPETTKHIIQSNWVFQAATPYAFPAGDVEVKSGAAIGCNLLSGGFSPTNHPTCTVTVNGNLTVTSTSYLWGNGTGVRGTSVNVGSHGGQVAKTASSTVYDSILRPTHPD